MSESPATASWNPARVSIAALVDGTDWSRLPLGAPQTWPASLQVAFRICRTSRFPIILFWGPELVQLYNDAYAPILGARHPHAFGQRARACWPEIWDSIGPMLHGVLSTGEATWSENLLLPLERNGIPEELYFTFSYSPIADEDGVGGVFCAVTETTAAVLRERDARERAEALAALDRAKTEFFNNVSHEFRTPLTLMLGPLDALAQRSETQDRPLLDVAKRNALRLLKLVNTLLEFSRLEAGRRDASFVETDLAAFTNDLTSGFRAAIEHLGLALIVRTDLREPAFVDRAMWETIVLNLLSNAVKFTLEGTIRVDLAARDGHVELRVSDTGVGIPPDELAHVFQRFRQVRCARARSQEGSGIGLALARELAHLHGGTIDVESRLGAGTTFCVRVPLGRAHLDPAQIVVDPDHVHASSLEQYLADVDATIDGGAAAPWPRRTEGESNRARILLADDNRDLRDYVSHVLAPLHEVVVVKNGREALEALRSGDFDLIVSDSAMPELDGFGLLDAVRADDALGATPFIFLSARADRRSTIDGLRRGANDYLIKPFTADELIARVNAQLGTARRQEAFFERRTMRRWFERRDDGATNDVAFRAFADQLPIMIWQQDVDGSISFTNAAWYETLRLPRDPRSHTADSWGSIIHPDDFPRMMATTSAAVETRSPFAVTYRLRPQGTGERDYRWYVAQANPQVDADGTFRGWIGSISDVHESQLREEAERKLRIQVSKALEDFQALAEALPTIVWTARPDGAGEYFNGRLFEYAGMAPEDAVGDGWTALVHPEDLALAADTWRRSLAHASPYEVTYRLRRKDGAYRWFAARGLPLIGADGDVVRWIGTCTDVDDAKRQYDRERRASEAFQEAALPKSLPQIPGLAFSAVYRAGRAEALVGGDWYDAFRLIDGRIVLSVGDVMGSGLEAAVMMSAVRQSIRGAAQIYPDPSAVIDAADRVLRSEHPDAIVTAFVGVFDPVTHDITYSSAGHPPPMLRDDAGTVTLLEGTGPPLGLRPDTPEAGSLTLHVPTSSMLVLYTDGLTEATRDIAAGEARLLAAMGSAAVLEARDPARAIAEATLESVHDDVAILVVRFEDARRSLRRADREADRETRWRFEVDDALAARGARLAIVEELRRYGVSDADAATTELLYSELLGNVVRHIGGVVEVVLDLSAAPVLHVLDRGPGFRFTTRLPGSVLSESGRGLYIVSMLAREFSVIPRPGGGSHARAVLPFALRETSVTAAASVRAPTT